MKNKRWLLYVIFGLVFYLLFLIIEMPAVWFAWGLNRYTQGTVRLDPIGGSLWSGNGRLVVYYPQTTPRDLGQTEWRINPLWLLTGRVQLSVQANHQGQQVKTTLGISRNSLMFKDTDIVMPAALIAQIYPPLSLISPQGEVRLNTDQLTIAPDKMEGNAALEWKNAVSNLSSVRPLGDYRLDIVGTGNNANLKLATLRGDLEFTGEGQWQRQNGALHLAGTAIARQHAEELKPLLQLLGKETEAGRTNFSLTSRLPL